MCDLVGKYELVSNEGLPEFYKLLGSTFEPDSKITFELHKNEDGTWAQIITTNDDHAVSYVFESGVEFHDLNGVSTTITIDGNTVNQVQALPSIKLFATRVFNVQDGSMVTTVKAEGVDLSPTATFKKVAAA